MSLNIVCYYAGTGLDVIIPFNTVAEFQQWKVEKCEAYIATSLRRGASMDFIKTECRGALEFLHREILDKIGDGEYTLKKIKKLWKEEFNTKLGMWYMNVACLIKLKVLQDDGMNGWSFISPFAMAVLTAAGRASETSLEWHKCGFCQKEAFNKCQRCRTAYYCGAECQQADWKCHKTCCVVKH